MPFADHQRGKACLALFAIAVLLCGVGNWILPLVDRDEPRFSEAAREMIERDDWVVPYFDNAYRFDKPPLIYWCQAAFYKTLGESEFAARLPSVLATGLITVIIYLLGRRLFGSREGWWAAIIFATSLQTLVHGRLAVADMLMVAFFALATWAGWELIRITKENGNSPANLKHGWWWVFWLALAGGFLAKGPVALLPIAALIAYKFWSKSRSPISATGWIIGAAICLGAVALWGIPALTRTHGEFARIGLGKHVIKRSVQPLEGHGLGGAVGYIASLPLYFVTIFFSFFPWSISLPKLIQGERRSAQLAPENRWLVCTIAVVFLPFSLVATKLPHYILPAMPALALWWAGAWFRADRSEARLRRTGWIMAASAAAIGLLVFPALSPFFPTPRLVDSVKNWVHPTTEIGSTGYDEPSLVWYFRKYTRGFHVSMPAADLRAFMDRPGPRLCVMPTKDVQSSIGEIPAGWHSARVSGFNLVHARKVDLTVLVHD